MGLSVHESFFFFFFHFSADPCEKMDEWAQRDLLISVSFRWANHAEIPDSALWIYSLFSSFPSVEFFLTDICG